MRAVIDATALGRGLGGDETMLRGALRGLVAEADGSAGDELHVLVGDPDAAPAELRAAPGVAVEAVRPLPGATHFPLRLPWLLARRERDADVVMTVTHGPVHSPVPVALMVQDLSFRHRPDLYPAATRARLNALVPAQCRAARVVLTVSEYSRMDLVATYGLPPERVHHVPNAIEAPRRLDAAAEARARAWLAARSVTGRYVLSLGNLHPRKNVARAIEAFGMARAAAPALQDVRLVVAGARWWGRGEAEAAASLGDAVVLLGPVDDDVREVLLTDALALVYVSLFEGFGLPPLEAMARGTAAVVSDATSLPEVVGDAALVVDPTDVGAIADALVVVLVDEGRRAELVRRGRVRAASYDHRRTGAALWAALRHAAELDDPIGAGT